MTAYYNEIDPYAAQWLRNLIAADHIAPGIVDERSIEDVRPDELAGYTQCHFFAGIGVWSLALRNAGWPDDQPVWTGSCPCQPFSGAGKGAGFDDKRHLWPAFQWLIAQRGPSIIFGEQVASKAVEPWIDLVHADVEALGYAFGCEPFPSAGIGAPHIRDRAYWVADSGGWRFNWRSKAAGPGEGPRTGDAVGRETGGMAHTGRSRVRDSRCGQDAGEARGSEGERHQRQWVRDDTGYADGSHSVGLSDADSEVQGRRRIQGPGEGAGSCAGATRERPPRLCQTDGGGPAGPVNGLWGTADWLLCRDGKWRPVEPGTFPLAHGAPNRVGRLRAYGNAINAQAAQIFIESVMSTPPNTQGGTE